MLWIIALIFSSLAVTLLLGKGSFLIAGYNTASKAEKSKYDSKKLCRVVGSGMGVISAFLIVLACFKNSPPSWLIVLLPIVIIAVTVVMIVLCNTICKASNTSNLQVEVFDGGKDNKLATKVALIVTGVILVIVGIALFTGEFTTTIQGNNININSSDWADYTVPLDSIKSISYVENLDLGKRTNGLGSFKLSEGHFKNAKFGDYILYANASCKDYVVLDTSNGIVVINAKSLQETKDLYNLIFNIKNKEN